MSHVRHVILIHFICWDCESIRGFLNWQPQRTWDLYKRLLVLSRDCDDLGHTKVFLGAKNRQLLCHESFKCPAKSLIQACSFGDRFVISAARNLSRKNRDHLPFWPLHPVLEVTNPSPRSPALKRSLHLAARPMGTERAPHHLLFWVRSCREAIIANHIEDAKGYLEPWLWELADGRQTWVGWLLVHEIDPFHLCSKGLLISFAHEARDTSKT